MSSEQLGIPFSAVPHLLGGFVVMLCIGLVMFGITISQAYSYSLLGARDPPLLKGVVALTVILEAMHAALNIQTIYQHFVIDFGNTLPIIFIDRGEKCVTVTVMLTLLLARCFNVYRVYHLTHNNLKLTILVAIVSAANVGVGFGAFAGNVLKYDTWIQFNASQTASNALIATMAISAFDDILVAAILIYHLRQMKTGFNRRTDHLITVIIVYAVHTGIATAIATLLVAVLYGVMKDSFIYQGAYILVGRAYGVAVIGTLNQRQYFKERDPVVVTDSAMVLNDVSTTSSSQKRSRKPVEIYKNIDKTIDASSSVDLEFKRPVGDDSILGHSHHIV